jgi:repressor LexA
MAYYSPTVREIAAAMSIKSPHGVTVHLEALERKGYIRMAQGKPRGIEVVHEG